MVQPVEREPVPKAPEGVVERPTEIPKEVERVPGVTTTHSQVAAQVSDDQGKPLIQTPATQTITIQIPADTSQLMDWAKGAPTSSITWFAIFWLRMIKKALHFGWKTVFKTASVPVPAQQPKQQTNN